MPFVPVAMYVPILLSVDARSSGYKIVVVCVCWSVFIPLRWGEIETEIFQVNLVVVSNEYRIAAVNIRLAACFTGEGTYSLLSVVRTVFYLYLHAVQSAYCSVLLYCTVCLYPHTSTVSLLLLCTAVYCL